MKRNHFLDNLAAGRPQLGLWNNLRGMAATEIAASAGFDWLLLDQEHSPRSLDELAISLSVIEGCGTSAVVRVGSHDPHEIGRVLDLGARTVLVPMVETAEQADRIAAACDFAPRGIRGVSAQTRGGSWGNDAGYLQEARGNICLILQIESLPGLQNASGIMAAGGVDAVFLGTADLAASMGHLGEPKHPEVQAAARHIVELAASLKMPLGTLTKNPADCSTALSSGYAFAAVGTDTAMLAATYRETLSHFTSTEKGNRNE